MSLARQSHQYQVRSLTTDQLLKAGTIQVKHTYQKGWVGKSYNPRTISNILAKVADTFNLNVTDLEIIFFESGS